MIGMSDLPSRVNRCRGCPHIIILQGILLLSTYLFIEGVSNRRDFIYVQAFTGLINNLWLDIHRGANTPFYVASMSHGGFRMVWKPLEMLASMSHNLVQHEASNSD
jgi:hypothetical protein